MGELALLNFGCGSIQPEGWTNVDRQDFGQEHVEDATDPGGLPFGDATFDGILCSHSLQENTYDELPVVLAELHRVLKPGGWIRVLWPNLNAAIAAYQRGDRDWFPINDQEPSLDDALCCYANWFSTAKVLCTEARLLTLLRRAGFPAPRIATFGVSAVDGLAALDDREPEEQLIVEAMR